MEETKSTHRVEIVPVVLEKHPNADSLSIVRVWEYTVVVRTADWQSVDRGAYVVPDSVMPNTPEWAFLKETPSSRTQRQALTDSLCANALDVGEYDQKLAEIEAKVAANTKGLRIKVKKLRGIVSMGMLVPAPEGSQIGDDVAEQLGVTHYEPRAEGDGPGLGIDCVAPPPVYAPKYDIESFYKYARLFEPGELVYVTEKIHGQNARFVNVAKLETSQEAWNSPLGPGIEETMYAGSRSEWKEQAGGSNWWNVQKTNPWIPEWCMDNFNWVLYGEIYGWVQSLRYGATPERRQLWFRAFDILVGTQFMDVEPFMAAFPEDHRVPCLGIMSFDVEKFKTLADGNTLVPGANHIREGIVIRPIKERTDPHLGRVILKVVSNAYLEKSDR